jgi:eukaryotic-like serine/threonine-protein kinase
MIPGTRLGYYEITGKLGQGGMGEVYRARDTRLDRDVAIKVLPEVFSADRERTARFEREAKILASLHHPNIAGIYGIEEADTKRYLILELIQGQTLAERIASGPLPLDEAVEVATGILNALEAAHEKGIVHRDLKPANVMLEVSGHVKVLDFGLAKALAPEDASGAANTSNSPTLTSVGTQLGVILGTAAYMAPEQAKGRAADKRSDVWAFGCVFYEMLTGRRIFHGEDVSETLAAVLRADPEWNALPAGVTPRLRTLLKRCLERDPKARIPDVSAVKFLLQDAIVDANGPVAASRSPRPVWKRALPYALTAVVAAAVTWAAVSILTPVARPSVTRLQLTLPEGQFFTNVGRNVIAISPDGTKIVYNAGSRLQLRSMSEAESRPIPGTEVFQGVTSPVFSPDGQWVAFYAVSDRAIKRIPVGGGVATTICDADNVFGLSWDEHDLVFGQDTGERGIQRVSESGGRPQLIVPVSDNEIADGPQMLPGGTAVLFTLGSAGGGEQWDKAKVVVQTLKSGQRTTLIEGASAARYVPTGHILYAIRGTMFAASFDPDRLEVRGSRIPVIEGVRRAYLATGAAFYSVSDTGTLLFVPGVPGTSAANSVLALADRKGGIEPLKVPPGPYQYPRVSPVDGKRVVFGADDGQRAMLYLYDLSGTSAIQPLAFAGNNRYPTWSPDGKRIAFQSDREGDFGIFAQAVDGSGNAERLTTSRSGEAHIPQSWHGDRLLFDVRSANGFALWSVSLPDKKAAPLDAIQSATPINPMFSPDGRWIVYLIGPSRGRKVFVQPYPATGARHQLFLHANDEPYSAVWSLDGKELIYVPRSGAMEAVTVTTSPTFSFGNPVPINRSFSLSATAFTRMFDITPGGKFLTVHSGNASEIHVVLNWFEELKAAVK